jgi:hypothetical protein
MMIKKKVVAWWQHRPMTLCCDAAMQNNKRLERMSTLSGKVLEVLQPRKHLQAV